MVTCFWCYKKLTKKEATKDHLIPRSMGGKKNIFNIRTACYSCNQERGKALSEFTRKWILLEKERMGYSIIRIKRKR